MTIAIQKDDCSLTTGAGGEAAARGLPGLTVAVLSARMPDYAAGLIAAGARVLCADGAEAGLLVRECPDVLVIDAPRGLSPRQIGLIVRQLRWGCRDMVVIEATGMVGTPCPYPVDLGFDPDLGPDHAADALAMARHLLCHSRLRALPAPSVASVSLLRRDAPRRAGLFR
jgi:hypothetical protein